MAELRKTCIKIYISVIKWYTFMLHRYKMYDKSKIRSMAQCKTAVTPLLTHWSYCKLALNHQDNLYLVAHKNYLTSMYCINIPNCTVFILLFCFTFIRIRYVDITLTYEVTPVTVRYIHQPHHGYPKVMVMVMDDQLTSLFSMSIHPPIPEIRLFILQGQDHGYGQRAKPYSQPSI